ncbi:MAG: hypothetical protein KC505_06090 [Myxococcales bacterium]|nr:hypothetical protein [Myxococcales bacterium]USN50016.1 MAG: hypothetical protein H6731_07005 [Myxococcales bacterium]
MKILLLISTMLVSINLFSNNMDLLNQLNDQEIAQLENAMADQGLELNEANLDTFLLDTFQKVVEIGKGIAKTVVEAGTEALSSAAGAAAESAVGHFTSKLGGGQ